MTPTLQQVYDFARKLCLDTEVSGGQRFTNPFLQEFGEAAYADIFTAFTLANLPRIYRDTYFILDPHTTVLYPETAGITNIQEPRFVSERSVDLDRVMTVTGLEPQITLDGQPRADHCRVNVGPVQHSLVDGNLVTVWGAPTSFVSLDIEDEWMVQVGGVSDFILAGCRAQRLVAGPMPVDGRMSVYQSTERFVELTMVKEIQPRIGGPGGSLGQVKWEAGRWNFPGATVARQLKISYFLGGKLPTGPAADPYSVSLGIDGCLNYMSYAVAARALQADAPGLAASYGRTAWGGDGVEPPLHQPGGYLRLLMQPAKRGRQMLPIDRPAYAPSRLMRRRTPV